MIFGGDRYRFTLQHLKKHRKTGAQGGQGADKLRATEFSYFSILIALFGKQLGHFMGTRLIQELTKKAHATFEESQDFNSIYWQKLRANEFFKKHRILVTKSTK